jgi:hypothetical protein
LSLFDQNIVPINAPGLPSILNDNNAKVIAHHSPRFLHRWWVALTLPLVSEFPRLHITDWTSELKG